MNSFAEKEEDRRESWKKSQESKSSRIPLSPQTGFSSTRKNSYLKFDLPTKYKAEDIENRKIINIH